MNTSHLLLVALALGGHLMIPVEGHAQQVPDWLLKLRLPNSSAKAIMTLTAWGAAFGSAYLGVGGTQRTPYLSAADGIMGLGYGMGDPVLGVGLQIGTTISDLSDFNNVSFSFKLHQYLASGTTIALGGESLFSNNALADDAEDTFYLGPVNTKGRFVVYWGYENHRVPISSDRGLLSASARQCEHLQSRSA